MRGLIILAALAATMSPAFAQSAEPTQGVVTKRGAIVYDASAKRLGAVLAVRNDGAVMIHFRSGPVVLPAGSLSLVDGKLTTSLTRAEVAKLD